MLPAIPNALPPDLRRVDLQSDAHLAKIQPGSSREVPKASIEIAKNTDRPPQEGWARQAQFERSVGAGWEAGSDRSWQNFASGRKSPSAPRRGTVEVDGSAWNAGARSQAPKFDQAKSGWDKVRLAQQSAAEFEESQRGGALRGVLGFFGL